MAQSSERSKPASPKWLLTLTVAGWLAIAAAGTSTGQENAMGRTLFDNDANCFFCHGWAGDGEGDPHAENGPSLRTTLLTRDQIAEVIKCGRPTTAMPHFDRFAYTDDRCYGLTADQLSDNVPPRASNTLQGRQIEAIADYVFATFVGAGPVTLEGCQAHFGGENRLCQEYPREADLPPPAGP